MVKQPRTAKVLFSLIVSMTIGAGVLLLLEDKPLPAGAFSLASYTHLGSVEEAINTYGPESSARAGESKRWQSIEVFYSKTAGGNLEQVASLNGIRNSEDLNLHFLICNGRGGQDGQIQASERWKRQWSCVPGGRWYGGSRTIRVCLIADGALVPPSEFQIKRTNLLLETLCIKFNIPADEVIYPVGWQL
jgi:hypothetical protein